MSEIHHPPSHAKSFGALLLEVVMIGFAVFLGLLADEWRETRQHHEAAQQALRNFRAELLTNQTVITSERGYHELLQKNLHTFETLPSPKSMETFRSTVRFSGVHPIAFEHTAWDLALATQALVYVDPQLAFDVSHAYTEQRRLESLQTGFIQAVQGPETFSGVDMTGLGAALTNYFEDVNIMEPRILKVYQTLIPQLNLALGGETSKP